MNLKESGKKYIEGFGGRKRKGEIKQLKYNIKIKKSMKEWKGKML